MRDLAMPLEDEPVDRGGQHSARPTSGGEPEVPLEEMAQAVLHELPVGILTCDERGRPTLMNPMMRRFFGVDDGASLPAVWPAGCRLYLPDGVTRVRPDEEPWQRALRGEHVRNFEMTVAPPLRASRVIAVDAQPLIGRDGRRLGLLVVAQDVTDRSWAEAELLETARRYTSIVESVKEVIFQVNRGGAWSFLNRAWIDMTGADLSRSLGRPWLDSLHPDDRDRAAASFDALLAGGAGTYRLELRLLTELGAPRWIELFARRMVEPDGSVIGASGTFHDITDRKRADEALHLSDQILRQLPEAVIVTDLEGRIERWMGKAAQHFGYEADEALGQPLRFLCRADFADRLTTERFGGSGGAPQVQELVCVRKDGSEIPVELTAEPIYDTERRASFIVAVARDLSERKRAEAERARLIREQAARAEAERAASRSALLAEATTALTVSLEYDVALEGMARLVVPAVADWCLVDLLDEKGAPERVVMLASTAAQTRLLASLVDDWPLPKVAAGLSEEAVSCVVREVREAGLPDLAAAEPTAAAALLPGSLIVVPLTARGETIGALTVARSERSPPFNAGERALMHELARRSALAIDNARLYHRAQKAIELRDEFLSIASHELKTPLQTLTLLAEALRRKVEGSPDGLVPADSITKPLATVGRQTNRLSQLIRELFDVTRIHGGQLELKLEEVELRALIHEVVERFSDELARSRCTVNTDEVAPLRGRWDAMRLEQVMTNLLTNAIKYGAGSPIRIAAESNDEVASIVVQDHGIGISKEDQERIFRRFERAVSSLNFGGLGLGLYITHQIVQAHGGAIEVESEPEVGSTFTVRLPLSPPSAT